jgi:hypothetical protein
MSLAGVALSALLAGAGLKVEFGPLRKASVLPIGHCDVEVVFGLVINDGGSEDYYCPRIEWQWEDGSISEEESDCPRPTLKLPPTIIATSGRDVGRFKEAVDTL